MTTKEKIAWIGALGVIGAAIVGQWPAWIYPIPDESCPNISGKWHSDGNGTTMNIIQNSCNDIRAEFPEQTLSARWDEAHDQFSYEVERTIGGCLTQMHGYIQVENNRKISSHIVGTDGKCDLPSNFKEVLNWQSS
ncbi:MAG: hypothetical protein PHT19_04510 [Methylococcus sp.]|nr:hypothetical protein [Methylococcus sp.]